MNIDQNFILNKINRFVSWIDCFGETSFDHQTFFAGSFGRFSKELYYRKPIAGIFTVFPMIFIEACIPSGRKFFWKKQRFPIADAHYSIGFAYLHKITHNYKYLNKSVHFAKHLIKSKCQGYENFCWGYPFDWVTRNGTIAKGTPLITTTPYVYEAFDLLYSIDRNKAWHRIMESIANHAISDIQDFEYSATAKSCAYFPDDPIGGVINASAYRAFLLAHAAERFNNNNYWQIAEQNLNFVLENQQANGCWYYAADNIRDFVDHFHTCFVLKSLAKIEQLTGHEGCTKAIEKGIEFYVENLFDEKGLPKPFSSAPRLTVYKKELYDYAECINLGLLLKGRFKKLDQRVATTIEDLLARWQKPDGSFRARELYFGWDNMPMHRWAQSQIFRSLSLLLYENYINKTD